MLDQHVDFPALRSLGLDSSEIPVDVALTGTGLDKLLQIFAEDQGLQYRVDDGELADAIRAASEMNDLVVQAIVATGVANDGDLRPADAYEISDWIAGNALASWTVAHGNDEGNEETGFHLIQNDGGDRYLFGDQAVNTIADGIYHLGFGYRKDHLINEDGDANARLEDVAFWLSALLAEDLANGSLANPAVGPEPAGTSGTGLDHLVEVIYDDAGLSRRIPLAEIREGASAADGMNLIVVDAIKALGVANDGSLTASDIYGVADHIAANHLEEWTLLHGDDEEGIETGFHLVQNDGVLTQLFGNNAVNTVADGIYHLGFGYSHGRLTNEDGDANARVEEVAYWLSELLADDLDAGTLINTAVEPIPAGMTMTGLDDIVEIIATDPGLNQRVPLGELVEAANAADAMNQIILDGIVALGLADDGVLRVSETYALSDWIAGNRFAEWLLHHGDDERGVETGYHLVQNDGALTRAFSENAIDTVADGIYHLGFGYRGDRLINEDGNNNERVEDVTYWLNSYLASDLSGLASGAGVLPRGVTGTGLDRLVDTILDDAELNRRLPLDEIVEGANAAVEMNKIILDGIVATGIANNGSFSAGDIRLLADWIGENRYQDWLLHHGDDEAGVETGFHLVQNDGAKDRLFSENAVNTVADGLYHLGFGYNSYAIINEDGNSNASLTNLAYWLEELLEVELADGSLDGPAGLIVEGSTGTGLDQIVNAIMTDPALAGKYNTIEAAEAAASADALNEMLIEAIKATGAANDGRISTADLREIDAYIAANMQPAWDAFLGDDQIVDVGVRSILGWVAVNQLVGQNAVEDVARGIYALGHGFKWDRVVDNEGNTTERVEDVALWLEVLLKDALNDGSLSNPALDPVDPASFADDLVTATEDVVTPATGPLVIDHAPDLEIASGAVAATVRPDDIDNERMAIFSKDVKDFEDGGHVTAYVEGEHLVVRLQDETEDFYLKSDWGSIREGISYDIVLNFSADGAELWLNGEKVDDNPDAVIDWRSNTNPLIVGGTTMWSRAGDLSNIYDLFDGRIETVQVYDRPLEKPEILGLNVSGPLGLPSVGAPEIPFAKAPDVLPEGAGLVGEVWDQAEHFGSIRDVVELAGSGAAPKHTLSTAAIDFEGGADEETLSSFLGDGAILNSGDGAAVMDAMGFRFSGFVYIEPGEHLVTVRSDDGMLLRLGGEEFITFSNSRGTAPTSGFAEFEGGLYEFELFYFENSGGQSLSVEIDGTVLDDRSFFPTREAFENGAPGPVDTGSELTGTGLDQLVDWILDDQGLRNRIGSADIEAGAAAAGKMNSIILTAIAETGAADDAEISAGDTYDLADWINQNAYEEWTEFHGDDEQGIETGFHLVQNDGAAAYRFGEAAIDTVADGIYHLGFGYRDDRLINEDGDRNQRVEEVAHWLNELLAEDLSAGTLASGASTPVTGTTGTGLDLLVELAAQDPELLRRLPGSELREGLTAADEMNKLTIEGIKATGIANDGKITAAEVAGLADWIIENHEAEWIELHGDDENDTETGFHLIQNDGAITRRFGENAVDSVADGLYHLGFGYDGRNLINEDGNRNAELEDVAFYLNELLEDDYAAGTLINDNVSPVPAGTTGTGLDRYVQIIADDPGLNRNIPLADIQAGAEAANEMNKIIVEAIERLGYANDGRLSYSEIRGLADDIAANSFAEWTLWHGDDEDGIETAFHLVQNDGATTRLFSENAVNTVIDAVYHLGFGYRGDRLINEDGKSNQRIANVADWMNHALAHDFEAGTLVNPGVDPLPKGTTGTGLDRFVDAITSDSGLEERISINEIVEGARAADEMNKIILEGIEATGIGRNGQITAADVRTLSDWIAANRFEDWMIWHGDDEANEETAFHLVQNDGAEGRLFGENAVNTVIDGVYHLGFGYVKDRLVNEDGDNNQRLIDIAHWLEAALADELLADTLGGTSPYVLGSTGTGLDLIVNMITQDVELNRDLDTSAIAVAAEAAAQMNERILEGIRTLDLARDGRITAVDAADLSHWLVETHGADWAALHGKDGTAFDTADESGAASTLFDHLGVDHVADAIYHLGFAIRPQWTGSVKNERVVDQNGNADFSVRDVAAWLEELLAADLANGALTVGEPGPKPSDQDIVVSLSGALALAGAEDALEIPSGPDLALPEATIALDFTASSLEERATLFSRDYAGNETGGHITAFIDNGKLRVRIQDETHDYHLDSGDLEILAGSDYSFALTFGGQGAGLYLNGIKIDTAPALTVDWTTNSNGLIVGGSGMYRNQRRPDDIRDPFIGEIRGFAVYDRAVSSSEAAALNTAGDLPGWQGRDDMILGSAGDDALSGYAGDDTLAGLQGADILDGGAGEDTADYSDSPDRVFVALNGDFVSSGDAEGDSLRAIEHLVGSGFADLLRGDGGANALSGGGADDYLQGLSGDDTLSGGEGNDVLEGGAGADSLNGGGGTGDFVSALDATGPVVIDLLDPSSSSPDYAGDTYVNLEGIIGVAGFANTLTADNQGWVLGGGNEDDVLTGGGGRDVLVGFAGNDEMFGGGNQDTFIGDAGDDRMSGGSGPDLFLFVDDGQDVITDFEIPASGFTDRVVFTGGELGFGDLVFSTDINGDAVISYGAGSSVTFEGVDLATLLDGSDPLNPVQPDWILVFA